MRKKTIDELYERLEEAIGDLIYMGASEKEVKYEVDRYIEEATFTRDQNIIDRYIEEKGSQ